MDFFSHLGFHRRLSHGDFEPGRTFAFFSRIGHSEFCQHRRESCAIGHSFTIFNTISMRTLRPRGRRNRVMMPCGVYSPEDWLHQRGAHRCLLCGEDGGVDVRGDRRLYISTDRPTAWKRGRVARRTSAAFWKPGRSRGSRSLRKMCSPGGGGSMRMQVCLFTCIIRLKKILPVVIVWN